MREWNSRQEERWRIEKKVSENTVTELEKNRDAVRKKEKWVKEGSS